MVVMLDAMMMVVMVGVIGNDGDNVDGCNHDSDGGGGDDDDDDGVVRCIFLNLNMVGKREMREERKLCANERK